MQILGLHIFDVLIIIFYLVGMMWIGKRLAEFVKNQSDFFLAGRKLGKLIQFFLNFGNMTDANGAASIASVIFKNGVAGVWIGFQTLFMTPYYWFMNAWFRRVRLVTVADLFVDRFGSKFLAGLYAAFTIGLATASIGWGYLVSYKVMETIMVKPASEYSVKEQQVVSRFAEYKNLKNMSMQGRLTQEENGRYETLKSLYNKGQIKSGISYLNPIIFYIIYGATVAIYVTLGGFGAAAATDIVQGLLIMVFSVMLIPIGLFKLGGFSGLHGRVPEYMFSLSGSAGISEYTWYSILAILFTSWVQIHAVLNNMSVAGSAKDELSARVGAVSGGFAKRFMIIAWSLCGLIAVGLFSSVISDADNTWGVLTKELLRPGLIGLMLAGILAANMSTVSAMSLSVSALFVRNLYSVVVSNKSEKQYVWVGRLTVAVVLALGMIVALYATGVIELLKFIIAVGVTFGAPILVLFFWRRLTRTAVFVEVIACFLVIGLCPWVMSAIPGAKTSKSLTISTKERVVSATAYATEADVQAGLAAKTGQKIKKEQKIEPVAIFFESLAHVDPYDKSSELIGIGTFNAEVYIMSKLGMDVRSLSSAGLLTTRFLFDGIFPFVILFVVSLFTKPTNKEMLDRFYVKMKTPVQSDPEADAAELEKSYARPDRFNHLKIFPKSSWEMCKWDKQDTVGFALCWVMVGFILAVFWLVLNVGKTILV